MNIVKVKGKEYVINYSVNTLVRMEKAQGKSFLQMFSNEQNIGLSAIRDIVYYGLVDKQNVSEEDAGDIISALIEEGYSLSEVGMLFTGELLKSLGLDKEVKIEKNA